MKCNNTLLEDYVEGFLNTAEKTELETHLSSCNKCQQTLKNLKTEQRLLATTLNETQLKSNLTENLMQEIKQHKQIKARRHRYKIMFITAAILMISFTLIATNKTSQHANVLPPNAPKDMETNEHHVADTKEELNTNGIPLHVGSILDIKIDSVIEKNGMKEITYRANYTEAMQKYSEATLQKLVSTYQLDASELPLRGSLHARISFAVRNSKNEVVATLYMGANESIKPVHAIGSQHHQATEVFGERITRFSLPIETDPTAFEIVGYLAELPIFSEPFTFKNNANTSFDYLGHTYTIYDKQLQDGGLHLSFSVDGQPEIMPSGWHITFNGTHQPNLTFYNVENNQTILTVILPEMQTIPDEMTMLPYLGIIQENFKPSIILDLKETVNK